jgi:MFS-type transporter involved in bile tolerance (Atg22 family)
MAIVLTDYLAHAIRAIFFGAAFSVFLIIRSLIMLDLMGRDHIVDLFGILNLFMGLGVFVVPLGSGALVEKFGDFKAGFWCNAVLQMVGALFLVAATLVRKRG